MVDVSNAVIETMDDEMAAVRLQNLNWDDEQVQREVARRLASGS